VLLLFVEEADNGSLMEPYQQTLVQVGIMGDQLVGKKQPTAVAV